MRTRLAIFMSKVRDNSAAKMILGACCDARARSLTIPRQAWTPRNYPSVESSLKPLWLSDLLRKSFIIDSEIAAKNLASRTQKKNKECISKVLMM